MIFKESTHQYIHEGELYKSVTSLISNYVPKTNWQEVAENWVAKRSKKEILKELSEKWNISFSQAEQKWGECEMTADWIRSVWKEKSKIATDAGTAYHLFKEKELSNEGIYNPVQDDIKAIHDLSNIEKGTHLELGIYSHKYKVCGQSDIAIIQDGSFIRDYKTNEEKPDPLSGSFYSKSKRKTVHKMFLSPLSHIICNDYWKYALQLSTYAYLLELFDIPNKGLEIIYVHTKWIPIEEVKDELVIYRQPEFNRARVVIEEEVIEMPYLKEEVKSMLNHYKQTK